MLVASKCPRSPRKECPLNTTVKNMLLWMVILVLIILA